MNIAMSTYPWNDNFAFGEFFSMVWFSFLIAALTGLVIGTAGSWLLREQIGRCNSCQRYFGGSRGFALGLFVFLVLLVSIPTLFGMDDRTVNAGNSDSAATTNEQQVEALEATIAGQLEARAASMGYSVVDSDVDNLTALVEVGTCEVELDLSGLTPQFVVDEGMAGVQRFEATHPYSLLRDLRQNGRHPLRECFTDEQLAPAT